MCGACACRGRYLQQLPSSSARHRKDILARCRGRLQQLSRMNTGRTSRPRRRTRSSCAVVPSRHNQRCAKPHAVRIPWRTRGLHALWAHPGRCMRSLGAACARGAWALHALAAPGALHALAAHPALHALAAHPAGRCMRSRRTACARGAPGWALHALAAPGALHALAAHPGRCMRSLYPHGAAATARCGCDRAHCGIRTVLPQSPWDVANVRWR